MIRMNRNKWEVLKRIGTLLFAWFVLMDATSPYLSRMMMVGEMEVESLLMSEVADKALEGVHPLGTGAGDWEDLSDGPGLFFFTAYFTYSIHYTEQAWQLEALAARASVKRYIVYRSLRVAC